MTGTHTQTLRSDLYEVAYLAGGPRRVIETAMVALVEAGRLRVERPTGLLHVVDPRGRHPVEAAVLDAVGPRGRSAWGLVRRARSDARLASVADGLARDGLLSPRGGVHAPERSFWTLSGLTRAGRAALRQARQGPPVTGGRGALAVALAGPNAWDAELLAAVFDPPRPYLPAGPAGGVRGAHRSSYVGYTDGGSAAGWGGGFGGDCGGGGGGGGDGGGGGC